MTPNFARIFSVSASPIFTVGFLLHLSGKMSPSTDTLLLIFIICVMFISVCINLFSNRRYSSYQPWSPGQDLKFHEKVEEKLRASNHTPESQQPGYKITLESSGRMRLQVIRVMRIMFTLGLKDAKDFAESAPQLIKQNATKAEADYVKQQLEERGAVVKVEQNELRRG